MSEERLERMENHIVQLIQMVAQNNEEVSELRQTAQGIELKFEAESKLDKQRHLELLGRNAKIDSDIDFLRNKVSQHDMDIHWIKNNTK
jgi:predicted RNase H-like nuclease (RuvC/YqgF family)